MRWPKKLSESELRELLPYAPTHGATHAYSDSFPEALSSAGVGLRDPARNTYLGVTFTRPEPNLVVLGVAYMDANDGDFDEDIYSVDLATGLLDKHRARSWERDRPEYSDTHHGDKIFLL